MSSSATDEELQENNNHQSEYVGLNPSGEQQHPLRPPPSPVAPLPKSRIFSYIKIALGLFAIRLCYEYSKPLAILAFMVLGIITAYQINVSSQQAIHDHDRRMMNSTRGFGSTDMDRINREREESEAMVAEAAKMMLEINRRHLNEFLITHPRCSYEQWIANLHPDNVEKSTSTTETGASVITIDHRFYVEDSDHRILWNDMIQPGEDERDYVPSRSSSLP